jgi:mRNA interferase RelE/StbE
MWRIDWTKKAKTQFKKINKKDQKRISNALEECADDPIIRTVQLVNSPLRRLKVGDYRIVILTQKNIMTINIIKVKHRRDAYKI